MSESKRQAEATTREIEGRYEKLDVDYKTLSEIFEEISAFATGAGPKELVLERIQKATHSHVSRISEDLEMIIADLPVGDLLEAGKIPFFAYVNQKLNTTYSSNDEVIRALSVAGPFAETEYAKANSAKYAATTKALDLVSNVDALELLGVAVDRTKMLEREAGLKEFKKEYEAQQKIHEDNLKVSGKLQGVKQFYDKSKSLVDYMCKVCGESRYIPCLVTADLAHKIVEVVFPATGKYFTSQLENTLNKALEGMIAKDMHKSDGNDTIIYGMTFDDTAPVVAHAEVANRLYSAQKDMDFHKLGFQLRIYTSTIVDDMQHVLLPPFPQEAEEPQGTDLVLDLTKK